MKASVDNRSFLLLGSIIISISPLRCISLSVSSCNDLGWTNAATFGSLDICGESEILHSCSGLVSFSEAENFCTMVGARLCSVEELLDDETRASGCSIDAKLVWSSSECGTQVGTQHMIALGATKAGVFSNCSVNEEVHYARCCADVYDSDNYINATISASSCDELGWDNAEVYGDIEVCGESEIEKQCSGLIPWSDAHQFCGQAGARLCTLTELQRDEARSTGCSIDAKQVWSSSECDQGYSVGLGGTGSGLFSNCSRSDQVHYARCCADVFIRDISNETVVISDDTISDDDDDVGVHSVSTCEDLGWDSETYGKSSICGGSEVEGVCSVKLTWNEALAFCESAGARLCTTKELLNDEARASGCALDRSQVWSNTLCGDEEGNTSHLISYGSQILSDSFQNCSKNENKYYTRCCADVFDSFILTEGPTSGPTLWTSSKKNDDDEMKEFEENMQFMRGSLRPVFDGFAIVIAIVILSLGCIKLFGAQSRKYS